jgi:hypothetical protein
MGSYNYSIIVAKHAPTRSASVAFKCQKLFIFARRQGRPKFLQWNEMGKKKKKRKNTNNNNLYFKIRFTITINN